MSIRAAYVCPNPNEGGRGAFMDLNVQRSIDYLNTAHDGFTTCLYYNADQSAFIEVPLEKYAYVSCNTQSITDCATQISTIPQVDFDYGQAAAAFGFGLILVMTCFLIAKPIGMMLDLVKKA